MKKDISNETELSLLKLGLYQIAGGVVGILLILWSIYKNQLFSGLVVFLYLIILLFYAYSIFCGALCMQAKSNALLHSLINQVLQFIGFTALGFAFNYVAGVSLTIGINFTESMKFDYGLGISDFLLRFNMESDKFIIDINLVAFGIIYWIEKLRKNIKEEIEMRKISTIVYSIGNKE